MILYRFKKIFVHKKKKNLTNLFYDRTILQNQGYSFADIMKQKTAYEGRILPGLYLVFFSITCTIISEFSFTAHSEHIFAGLYDLWMRYREFSRRLIDTLPYMTRHKTSTAQAYQQRQGYHHHLRLQVQGQSPNPPHG